MPVDPSLADPTIGSAPAVGGDESSPFYKAFVAAAGFDPDAEAKARQAARMLPAPVSAARAQPQLAQRQVAIRQQQENAQNVAQSPNAVQSWFSKLTNAIVGKDDTNILGTLGSFLAGGPVTAQAVHFFGAPVAKFGEQAGVDLEQNPRSVLHDIQPANLGKSVAAGVGNLGVGTFTGAESFLGDTAPGFVGGLVQKAQQQRQAWTQFRNANLTPDAQTFTGKAVNAGIEGLPTVGTAVIGSIFGGPEVGAGIFGATAGLSSYGEARDQGASANRALLYGGINAGINYGLGKFLGGQADAAAEKTVADEATGNNVGQFFKNFLTSKFVTQDIGLNALAGEAQNFNQWATLDENKGKTFRDWLNEQPAEIAQNIIGTLTMVGAMHGTGVAARMFDRLTGRAQARDQQMQQAEAAHQLLSEMSTLSAASKLRERDPVGFHDFISQASEDGPVDSVYVHPDQLTDALHQSAQAPGASEGEGAKTNPLDPVVAQELEAAAAVHKANGTDVRIPIADYETHIAGTSVDKALLDHLKTDPDGMTRQEAGDWLNQNGERVAQEMSDALSKVKEDTDWNQSVQNVHDDIKGKLDAANPAGARTNKNDSDAAMMSNFFSTMAARLKNAGDGKFADITPEDLYRQFGPRITGESNATAEGTPGRLDQVDSDGRGAGRGGAAGDLEEPRAASPLDGATKVRSADGELKPFGPVADVVRAARSYAKGAGIDLKRQSDWGRVNPELAERIAKAYEEAKHEPLNPKVKAAYEDMIHQTMAQYEALHEHGFRFHFVGAENDPYGGNPWNAMRDLRDNKRMGVFSTEAGFGSDENFDPNEHPLLADTGVQWPYGGPDGPLKRVLANDLFRAVHDAFGHGMEGAGFRAEGEENAWQAHARLFTGDALKALTSETRGQNSWLNFGPHGENNRTAKLEDTIFADQKATLLPDWAHEEGRVGDQEHEPDPVAEGDKLFQSAVDIQHQPLNVQGTGPGGRVTNRDFARALTERQRDAYGRELHPENSEEDYNTVKQALADDYRNQKQQPDAGEEWYKDDIAKAIEATKEIFPQLEDPRNQDLFLTMAALLSPQQAPGMNWDNAMHAFKGYIETGKIALEKPSGKQFGVASHRSGLQMLQHLIDTHGLEGALNWVQETKTGREMAEMRRDSGLFTPKDKLGGYLPNETNLNDELPGIYAFGPKVGDFAMNSTGIDQNAVTVDLWATRTYNRITGRLLDVPKGVADNGGISDTPRGRGERDLIKSLIRDAAKEAGIEPSAMQAALWYFEQRLYENHGIKTKSESFSGAAQKAVLQRGGDPERLAQRLEQRESANAGRGAEALFQSAYHGSPHAFDRFSTDRIGTGEGHQAYGHGLYFAGNKEVAQHYRDALKYKGVDFKAEAEKALDAHVDSSKMYDRENALSAIRQGDMRAKMYGQDDKAAALYASRTSHDLRDIPPATLEKIMADYRQNATKTGHLYHVEIPDDHQYLDWDKRLDAQSPDVKQRLASMGVDLDQRAALTGEGLYDVLSREEGSARNASQALHDAGIPGLRYLDAGSRGDDVQQKHHNYVVFHDDNVAITHFEQEHNGAYSPAENIIALFKSANLSTFQHESAHFYLEFLNKLANDPEAPSQVRDDFNTIMDWFGIKGGAGEWNQMTLDQKREYHEKFARGFEAYLFSGKAPSLKLQPLFQRFRQFMMSVYQKISALGVKVSPDIRGVFDRMLATDDEISESEHARSMLPLGKEHFDDQSWQEYQRQLNDAHQGSVSELEARSLRDMQWLTNARGREISKLKRQNRETRVSTQRAVEAEVRSEPIYRAMDFFKKGLWNGEETGESHKLSIEEVKAMYPDEATQAVVMNKLGFGKYGMLGSENAIHPEQAADLFGYSSGDHLIRALMEAEPFNERVNGITEQRLLEDHGELTTEQGIKEAADRAIFSDLRARVMATELNALNKKAGRPAILAKAAQSYAETQIARTRVRDLKPSVFEAAAARAGRMVMEHLGKGKTTEAAVEKRNQLLNTYMAKEAIKAKDEIGKMLAYFDRMNRATGKQIDSSYLRQIHALLDRVDLKQGRTLKDIDRTTSLGEWIKDQQEQGFDPIITEDMAARLSQAGSYKNMSIEDLRGLRDSVKNIEALGRLKNKLLTAKDQREFDAARDMIADRIEGESYKDTTPPLETNTKTARFKKWGNEFLTSLRKLSSLVHEMDGFKTGGPLWEYFLRPINEAADREAAMISDATHALEPLFKGLGDLSKKEYIPEINTSLSLEGRLAIALNMGNDINRERVMTGENWDASQVDAILRTLSSDHWHFVQGVWDHIGSYWPEIAAKQLRVTGVEPERVQANPIRVHTADGQELELPGGYYPIKYNADRSTRAQSHDMAEVAKQMLQGAYTASTTRRGHTQERVASTGMPLRYDLGVIGQHVAQVIHDLTHHEMLIDTTRLLRDGRISSAVRNNYGPEVHAYMTKAIRDIAAGDQPAAEAMDKAINYLRTGAITSQLGWNLFVSTLHGTNLVKAMQQIGPKYVIHGITRWIGDLAHMESTVKWIAEQSTFMAGRASHGQKDMAEIQSKIAGEPMWKKVMTHSLFMMLEKGQLLADVPTWLGQYHKSVEAGEEHDRAVALADQAVLRIQGGGGMKDRAGILRGPRALRLFTAFYSFTNVNYNLMAEAMNRTQKEGLVKGSPQLVATTLSTMLFAAYAHLLVRAAYQGQMPDKKTLMMAAPASVMSLFPFTRDFASMVEGTSKDAALPGLPYEQIAKALADGMHGKHDEKALADYGNAAGIFLHYPTGQIIRTWRGIEAIAEGKTKNPGAVVVGPPPGTH